MTNKREKITLQETIQMEKYYSENGLSDKQIAKLYNVSRNTVRYHRYILNEYVNKKVSKENKKK